MITNGCGHGPILGVSKSVPARTDFDFFLNFPLLTRVIVWDSTAGCQFYG